ncbi:pseudouridine synthase [Novosphingobium sp. Chol11]|uniref:pseudouridine synthase n=1 Tax=Novosphingobium sp. Chol11 TaxID=1385763 RepID=UPI0025F53E3F|nr:ribosomal large subunit pseudouridine synthase B [Novosphingobium sp. Chol11]
MTFPPKDRSGRPPRSNDRAGSRPTAPARTPYDSGGGGGWGSGSKPATYKIPVPRTPKAAAVPLKRALADDGTPREGDRIAKLLARAGVASRREVERLIAEGRVTLGEDVVTTPATILKNLRGVSVDGKPVAPAAPARIFRFHKPSGLITAERDPTGRPTIYTALRNALPPGTPRMIPVGRLDLNTEGLLLLTNDGELKRALELPSTGIPRTYRARTFGPVMQDQLEELMQGVEIEGVRYGPINANMERSTGRNQWIELTLTEGKNREVRRVLEHLGLQVSRLLRTVYGPFELADLPRGAAEEVPQVMVERFRKSLLGLDPAAAPLDAAAQAARRVERARNSPQRPEGRD